MSNDIPLEYLDVLKTVLEFSDEQLREVGATETEIDAFHKVQEFVKENND